jgi:Zn ribbon nucleic-acid-binding protein
MTTECCGVAIAVDHRFCPKCGYEARVGPCTLEEFARQQADTDALWAVHEHGYQLGKRVAAEMKA